MNMTINNNNSRYLQYTNFHVSVKKLKVQRGVTNGWPPQAPEKSRPMFSRDAKPVQAL
jgi:hypothetical protein